MLLALFAIKFYYNKKCEILNSIATNITCIIRMLVKKLHKRLLNSFLIYQVVIAVNWAHYLAKSP